MSSLLDTHIQNKDAGNFCILKYFLFFKIHQKMDTLEGQPELKTVPEPIF